MRAVTNPNIQLHGDNLAYLIYTSGSTGKPKGVMVRHRALNNFLLSMQDKPGLTSEDTLVAVTSLSFDIAALELYLPLIAGAKLVLATRGDVREGQGLAQLIEKSQATVFQSTPSGWRLLLASGWQPKSAESESKKLKGLCGGEALPQDLAEELRSQGIDLWNMYGPTETTIWSAIKQLGGNVPTLGQPIADTQLHILDNELNSTPKGVAGELYISGAGLARGYAGRVDLTTAAFVASPFSSEGGRLYRTGDLVRWNKEGELEYLGRIDHQVKIRGFRIELGEIEAELLKQVDVSEAVVVAKESQSGARLIAYVAASADSVLDANELKVVLGQSLPDYMVPSDIVLLDALPLNPNGKIDRKALPEPEFISNNEYQAPEGEVEAQLAKIWCEVLGVEQVGRHGNFFELGGDSITSLRLVSKINHQLNCQLSVRNIFEQQTLKEQALLVINDEKNTPSLLLPILKPVPRQQYMPLSLSQTSLWLADKLASSAQDKSAYNIAGGVELNGALDSEKLNAAFDLVIARHEVFRMAFTEQEENPVVTLAPDIAFDMVQHDLSQLSIVDKIEAAQKIKRNFEAMPFDLTQAPLLRAELNILSSEKNSVISKYASHH